MFAIRYRPAILALALAAMNTAALSAMRPVVTVDPVPTQAPTQVRGSGLAGACSLPWLRHGGTPRRVLGRRWLCLPPLGRARIGDAHRRVHPRLHAGVRRRFADLTMASAGASTGIMLAPAS